MKRVVVLVGLVACGGGGSKSKEDAGAVAPDDAAVVKLPPAPPLPPIPLGLPKLELPDSVTPDAVALGELLFWDTRLSIDNTVACATCHDPNTGFATGSRGKTAGGKPNLRTAPTLVNLAWHGEFGWDGRYKSLDDQLRAHVQGQLGIDLERAVGRIGEVAGYRAHFTRLGSLTADTAATALAAFVLTRYEGNSSWDVAERSGSGGDFQRGYIVFTTRAQCATCHTPPLYTDLAYHRIGLVASPDEGRGRVDDTRKGAFKTPTLRDADNRHGFFHDGSAKTLDEAIDWHLDGGLGQKADPSIVDPPIKKLKLTADERRDLGQFVRSLTTTHADRKRPKLP